MSWEGAAAAQLIILQSKESRSKHLDNASYLSEPRPSGRGSLPPSLTVGAQSNSGLRGA